MSTRNLPDRARQREAAPSSPAGIVRQYLTFTLGAELFATPVAPIREIIEFQHMTEIPLTPPFIRGVINLRGAVVPVVDLSVRFGRARTEIRRRTCVVVTEVRLEETLHLMGVIVDAVNEVLDVDIGRIEARPEFGAGIRSDFVSGMLRLKDRFVVVIDIDNVLSLAELAQLVSTTGTGQEGLGGTRRRSLIVATA